MMPRATASNEPRDRTFLVLVLLTVAFLLTLALWRALHFGAPYGGDWAHYLAHAKALADGRPYADTGYLYSSDAWLVGPAVYPPGLPLSLAPIVAVFGESLVAPRVLMHVLLAAFLCAVYVYFARTGDRVLAIGTVALLGTSFLLKDSANVVGSDLGMCAFVWWSLALAEGSDEWTWGRTAALSLLGVLAITYRIAAAPLVPAMALWALVRGRSVGWRPWIVVALWAIALLVVLNAFGPGDQGSQAAAARVIEVGGVEHAGWERSVERLEARLMTYRYAVSDAFLYPFPFGWANALYHASGLVLAIVGIWGWLRGKWTRFGVVFGAGTFAMLLVLPVWVSRYAWTLTPFACYGLLRGLWLAVDRVPRVTEKAAGWLVSGGALLLSGLAIADLSGSLPERLPDDAAEWRALGPALAEQLPDLELRAASNRPRMLAWYSGIPAAGLPNATIDRFMEEVDRLGLTIVVISTSRTLEPEFARWRDWRRDHPDVFIPLYDSGGLEVYTINTRTSGNPEADE